MRYLLCGLLFLMTTSFCNEEIQMSKKKNELFLYTYYSVYRFQAVPYKMLEFHRNKVLYTGVVGKKIPVEQIIMQDGRYFIHVEGELKMDND